MTFLGGISGPTNSNSYVDYSHIAGLATGIDTDSMVQALMRAERMPLDRLLQQKQLWQWKQEDYRTVNNALRDLRDTMFSMKLQSTFLTKAATSSNPSIVTASPGTNASPATYTIDVTQLATPATAVSSQPTNISDPSAPLASTSTIVSFQIGNVNFDNVDLSTLSLDQVIAKVNTAPDANVVMGYDAYSKTVFISSRSTGTSSEFTLQDLDGNFLSSTLNLTTGTTFKGTDAEFSINGVNITSPSNEYTLNGTKLQLVGKGTATITVSRNVDAVVESIKNFVDKFNS
ncbi:MAG TPA: flagellar filament capping protein FliD, partial [Firmicutes bacterium]|nr:flagellar filament capping protein FliD [Bacillota bacterium]